MSGGPRGVDERAAAAGRLLAEHGLAGAEVGVEGHEREIAAIRVRGGDWERLVGDEGVRLAARVKALGFRYVALDLLPADAPSGEG
jgi:PP-loop superfamily ATP-utilizing enzyme